MVLSLGDVRHLLHGATVGEYVPLAPQPLVAEEVEQPLRRDGEPHRRGGAQHDPRRLAGVVDALPRHNPNVLVDAVAGVVELVPFVHC